MTFPRVGDPCPGRPTHDDRLLSAALIAEFDRLLRAGDLPLGATHSKVILNTDPLDHMQF